MSVQGQTLEITVVACYKLKNTEFISRQDPYVCLDYSGSKYRTRTCTDGGKNPTFNDEKFRITLIDGLRDINVTVWNSNTFTRDDFIGCGRIQLDKVIAEGYDDRTWALQTKSSRYAGDLKLITHIANPLQRYQWGPPNNIPPPAYPRAMEYPPPPSAYQHPPAYPTGYAPPPSMYPSAAPYPPQRHY